MKKPKYRKPMKKGDEPYWEFYGFDGLIEEGDMVIFTCNVAPAEIEDMEDIKNEIDNWQRLGNLILAFGGEDQVEIEPDYYWSETDLNIRVSVPLTHKLFQNEKSKTG